MPATESQIRVSGENAQRSSGPKTGEGKAASSANSDKHGMTATKVLPELEAIEVQRLFGAFCNELKPTGDIGFVYVLRAATLAARMERCVEYETAMLTERVRQAEADFVPPEGVDDAKAAQLRCEAGKRALFDPSPEATLARKYEAAAERGYTRCLKELRQHEKAKQAPRDIDFGGELGSFLPGEMDDAEFDQLYAETTAPAPRKVPNRSDLLDLPSPNRTVDVNFSIGKPQ